ncbi:MAG: hypothetical protein H3C68_00615 [Deltaproteobacteria bacterium]|nr:hypothetical protein [Deltaproteobacteria bacterium]MBZ0219246.1 hypothetical protein [Deltaproteobacteria bacterium]
MMPTYVCGKCKKEYCGWGAEYMIRSGRDSCPECEGELTEKKDAGKADARKNAARRGEAA